MVKHLKYGGSNAKRTFGCPGWVKKSKNITPRPAGAAAIEGSMHHAVMELCQKEGTAPEAHLGLVYKEPGTKTTQTFTEDDLDLSTIAYNATNALLEKLDIDEMEIEPFVEMVSGSAGGSVDVLGLSSDRKTLLIADYKFGTVMVSPVENEQGGVYGVSVMRDTSTAGMFNEVEKVVFAIIQPRVKGVVSTWETDVQWLLDFEQRFLEAMSKDNVNPGKHCKYWPAESICEEKRLNIISAKLLSKDHKDELQAAADLVEEVEAWVKSMKEELYLQLTRGVPITGWKIIDKRHTRKWIDDKVIYSAVKTLVAKDDCYKTTLLTPPQLEKVLKKKKVEFDLSDFITFESSGTTLAPADHASPAVIVSDVQGHLVDIMK